VSKEIRRRRCVHVHDATGFVSMATS
ncbi:hypothetical protein PC118_g24034, partial [Phytophthora cactorum]